MAGLSATGLEIKRTEDVIADMKAAVQAPGGLGPGVSVADDGPLGKLIGIFAAQIGALWELGQAEYDSLDPDQAEGESLDNLAAITGVTRLQPTPSTGIVTVSGTPATVVTAGSLVSQSATGQQFVILTEVTIPGGGSIDTDAEAVNDGPISAAAGSIDTIDTVIAGWSGVTNAADFTLGRDLESDSDLRLRRAASVSSVGGCTDQGIRARLLQEVTAATAVVVKSNRTDTTDADGIPPHAFESVLWPTTVDTTEVITVLYNTTPAGILAHGVDVTATVTTDEGGDVEFSFSYASELVTHVRIDVTTNDDYPADGDTQITDAVVAVGSSLSIGDPLYLVRLVCAAAGVAGVMSAVAYAKVGGSATPSDTADIIASFKEIITIDSGNVVVNS